MLRQQLCMPIMAMKTFAKVNRLVPIQSRNVIATSQDSHPDDEVFTSRMTGKQTGIVVCILLHNCL